MAALLNPDEALHRLSWCTPWIDGGPALKSGTQSALERAEQELGEAILEEERKVHEFRLCPHCGKQFIVGALNCGSFRCGRDADGGVGGAEVNGIYGCGQQFSIDQAARYVADESVLGPLRTKIDELRTGLDRCEKGASLWERARNMEVPILSFRIDKGSSGQQIVPTASILNQLRGDQSNTGTASLLQRLRDGSDFVFQQRVLPDLIEVCPGCF
jgi:hypothetical protein